ncbi:MAG: hypothetical protein JST64_13970 [Actinobacteria bacterium]|nr:hypothetical protein [Actinomycetota bacterium]
MSESERILHVERTTEPAVLRWVCHRSDLDATPIPPPGSLLSTMVEAEVLEVLTVTHGDLLVRLTCPDDIADVALVGGIHRAIGEALAMGGWSAPSGVTCVDVRRRRSAMPDGAR